MATLQPFQLIGQSPGPLFILWKRIGATLPQHFEDWMATLQPFQFIGQSPDQLFIPWKSIGSSFSTF